MLRLFVLVVFCAAFSACQNPSSSSNTPSSPELTTQASAVELPEDFKAFYQKFHTDSLFQLEHIAWPLQGDKSVRVDAERMEKRTTTWEKATWHMHRPVDFSSGEFKQHWEVLGDALIIERISYAAANYGLERRFVKQYNGEWELVYYSDMQEIGK